MITSGACSQIYFWNRDYLSLPRAIELMGHSDIQSSASNTHISVFLLCVAIYARVSAAFFHCKGWPVRPA